MSGRCTRRDVGISSRLVTVSASSMRTSLAETPPAGPPPPPQVPYSHGKPLCPQPLPSPQASGGEVTMYWRNKVCAMPLTPLCWVVGLGVGGMASRNSALPSEKQMTAEAKVMFIWRQGHGMTTSVCLMGSGVQGCFLTPPAPATHSWM